MWRVQGIDQEVNWGGGGAEVLKKGMKRSTGVWLGRRRKKSGGGCTIIAVVGQELFEFSELPSLQLLACFSAAYVVFKCSSKKWTLCCGSGRILFFLGSLIRIRNKNANTAVVQLLEYNVPHISLQSPFLDFLILSI